MLPADRTGDSQMALKSPASSGHAPHHASRFYLCVKRPICVLKASVTLCHRIVEVTEDKMIVIGVSNGMGHNSTIIYIQNRTEIDFVLRVPL